MIDFGSALKIALIEYAKTEKGKEIIERLKQDNQLKNKYNKSEHNDD